MFSITKINFGISFFSHWKKNCPNFITQKIKYFVFLVHRKVAYHVIYNLELDSIFHIYFIYCGFYILYSVIILHIWEKFWNHLEVIRSGSTTCRHVNKNIVLHYDQTFLFAIYMNNMNKLYILYVCMYEKLINTTDT